VTRTMVMIHGMWCGPWCWGNYRRYLEERGYRCIVPALRHHDVDPEAEPDPALGITSLLDYAADLEGEIERLGEAPILVGHSMGGLLAQILGSRGRARALVLLTSASPAGINALTPSVIRSFWSTLTRWGFWRRPHRPTLAEAVYSMLHLLPENEQTATHERFVHESGRAAAEIGFWPFDARKAARVDTSRITCPMLIVAGREDRITPASVARKVARRYATIATYRELAGHAHWVIAEPGWKEVAGLVGDWLDETLG
jgi:pimeloyl-ACP methyl ester carboxylesterase